MRLHELYIGEQVPYLQRPNSPYAKALADYLRLNPGKTEDDFKLLLPNQQNKYLDKYLEEGPVGRAIGTALLGLGLMGSPSADAGPDSAAYKAGYDGVQSVLSAPGKMFKSMKKDHEPFEITKTPSKTDTAYKQVLHTACETVASVVDKHYTKAKKGDFYHFARETIPGGVYDASKTPKVQTLEENPLFKIVDDGKGNGKCIFQFSTYKTVDGYDELFSRPDQQFQLYNTRQIQILFRKYQVNGVAYIANPKGTKPSLGVFAVPGTNGKQVINTHSDNNADKRIAPEKITDVTEVVLRDLGDNGKINFQALTDQYSK